MTGPSRTAGPSPRWWRLARLAMLACLAAIGGLLLSANAPRLGDWRPQVVLSESMAPALRPGDVALIGPAEASAGQLPPGRIVLVRDPARRTGSYLHRVVGYEGVDLVTKGDGNDVPDFPAVAPAQVAGQVRLVVPALGLPVLWADQGRYLPRALLALATLGALLIVLGAGREPAPRTARHTRAPARHARRSLLAARPGQGLWPGVR
ncbi:MAG TPA: S26 family signal peptidase [Pilimelia sp.]|nr:S26 family signal peptidase [Pilimelia sp.]